MPRKYQTVFSVQKGNNQALYENIS